MAFKDWEVPSLVRGKKMEEDEFSVITNKKDRHSITFNQKISSDVLSRNYKLVVIKQDDVTGEIGFEFNNERGLPIKTTGINREGKINNICLEAKKWVDRVAFELDFPMDGTRSIGKLTKNLSSLDRCMFYRIKNKQ